MSIELVTGFTGKAHISSLDVAKFNAGAFGPGEYVFAGVKDDKLKATMASSNKVHISSGNAMMQGRHFWVDAAGVDLTVQTGTQGQKRNDLVVARYAKNASTGVESVSLVVIKGTPTTGTPADPSYTRGDILNGNALANDMPLWRIPLNGITVGTPVQLFQEFASAKDAWDSVSQVDICDGVTACKQGKHVCVYVKIETTSGQNYTVVGSLPSGWQPRKYVLQRAYIVGGKPSTYEPYVEINGSGQVSISPMGVAGTMNCTVSYIAP